MRTRSEAKKAAAPKCLHLAALENLDPKCGECGLVLLPRKPDGRINNCAVNGGEREASCQMCRGACPDRDLWARDPAHAGLLGAGEAGAALAREIKASGREAREVPELFEHANRPKGMPQLRPDFERVVERVFNVPDVDAEYDHLERELVIGEQRGDRGTTSAALDGAHENARRAHRLYCNASLIAFSFDRDAELVESAMWGAASEVLEKEKAEGERKKQITDADVRHKAAAMFPDEWRAIQEKRRRVQLTVENCERLSKLWGDRCSGVETLLQSARK